MRISDYQRLAKRTAVYPKKYKVLYPTIGLAGEAGDLANKVKKRMRGDKKGADDIRMLKAEMGDVLWYVAQLATDLDLSLEDIAKENIDKLWERLKSNKIKGSGDYR